MAERTEKDLVSSVLMKLGKEHRTQAAVLVTNALSHSEDPEHGGYRFSLFPDLIAEVTAALLDCTSDAGTVPPTDALRAGRAVRLAEALAATLTRRTVSRPYQAGLRRQGRPRTGHRAPGATRRESCSYSRRCIVPKDFAVTGHERGTCGTTCGIAGYEEFRGCQLMRGRTTGGVRGYQDQRVG